MNYSGMLRGRKGKAGGMVKAIVKKSIKKGGKEYARI
jgi:hypothetical protein